MKIDEDYTLEGVPHNWILRYEKATGKVNKKTGKEEISKEQWYFPTIQSALKKYVDESLKPVKTINEVLLKIEELHEVINKLKVK